MIEDKENSQDTNSEALTPSQMEKRDVGVVASNGLMSFLTKQLSELSDGDDLYRATKELLIKRIKDEGDDLPYAFLAKVYELSAKNKNDALNPIYKIIEAQVKPAKLEEHDKDRDESHYSQDEIKKAKEFLKVANAIEFLKESEFDKKESKED